MAIQLTQTLVEETCITCGCLFAIPSELQRKRRENHENIYCPNGHAQFYPAKTEAEKLRAQLDQEQAKSADLLKQRDDLLAREAEAKKRAHAGICSECHRHFANVERHMERRHSKEAKSVK